MTNLRPLAYLSLPVLGTIMLLNLTVLRPHAKAKILLDLKMTRHHEMLIVKK
jgi:hypothetical protein